MQGERRFIDECAILKDKKESFPNSYTGVKEVSENLKKIEVSKKDILEFFERGTINLGEAGNAEYGIRFYGGATKPMGQYLTDTFNPMTNRSNLALPPKFNAMTGISQWQIKPGTIILTGKVGPQLDFGPQYVGGAVQTYIYKPWENNSLIIPGW